jgi:folate-binding protein YgfZ
MASDHNEEMIAFNDLPSPALVALPEWGVMVARGQDARSFLHGQLTQDIQHLQPGQCRLAGYCSAKGRLMATLLVWSNRPDEVFLASSADVLPGLAKRLSLFVLRADCKLQVLDVPVHGSWMLKADSAAPAAAPWSVQTDERDGSVSIRLPEVGSVIRTLHVGSKSPAEAAPTNHALDLWRALEVCSGIPRVVARTQDQFVPQMVNWELVGGVNFQKGCYPGQEVVARSQYRGTLKRRSFLFRLQDEATEVSVSPGDEVYAKDDPEQPAGMVVLAAPAWLGSNRSSAGCWALIEVKWAALQSSDATLHLGSAIGPRLLRMDLPYDIPLPELQA